MDAHAEWISWPEATEIIGCRVPTVDYNQRIGRIESRPYNGSHPTLKRESVEVFARWYAERTEKRRQPKPSLDAPPEPDGWVGTVQAAQLLGRTRGNIDVLIRSGQLEGVRRGRRLWLRESDVRSLIEQRNQWVSITAGAKLVGSTPRTVRQAVERGEIDQRTSGTTARPSLSRESVEAWAQARRERPPKPRKLPKPREPKVRPPDDEYDWIRAEEVGRLMGLTPGRVRQLAKANRLPCTRIGRTWWFRRDLVSNTVSARAFVAAAAAAGMAR